MKLGAQVKASLGLQFATTAAWTLDSRLTPTGFHQAQGV
jgi:hypothetical protein